jgi:hypothetical protein
VRSVSHIFLVLRCLLVLVFVLASYVQCFLCLCIVQSSLSLRLMSNVSCVSVLSSLHFPFVLCPMFPVSLYCPVFISPSSDVQCFLCLCIVQSSLPLRLMSNVSCVSVLSSLHFPFVLCPMFPVSLYCPVFIAPSSDVQCFLCLCIVQSSFPLRLMSNVSCVSVLSSLHFPFV